MKKPVIILLSISALLLGACASHQSQIASTAPATATQMSPSEEYINYVTKHAKAAHAELHWVHVPDDDDVDKTDS